MIEDSTLHNISTLQQYVIGQRITIQAGGVGTTSHYDRSPRGAECHGSSSRGESYGLPGGHENTLEGGHVELHFQSRSCHGGI